jgi:multidrug efflux pump
MIGPNLSAWALGHRQMVLFLILALSVAGAFAFMGLGQKEDPEFTVKAMLVEVRWPGASATQMADQVLDALEAELQELEQIDYTKSYARPGEAQITISLRDEIPGRDVDDIWYDVRRKLNDLKPMLPDGVQGPFFNEEFGDTYGNLYAVTGRDFSLAELETYAQTLKTRSSSFPTWRRCRSSALRTRSSSSRSTTRSPPPSASTPAP